MKVSHALGYDAYGVESHIVFQQFHLACPDCRRDIVYAVPQEEKLYREENEFLAYRCKEMSKELSCLKNILNDISDNRRE